MKIIYIPLGSFCYPKMIIRELNKETKESLPFDFHSSPHLDGITKILKELYENKTYKMKMTEIIDRHNTNELTIKENNLYVVHYFNDNDLKTHVNKFPVNINYIYENKINKVNDKFDRRFKRLYDILNDTNNILCFLRIENYDNGGWKYELNEFTKTLALFKNPNKYLIYTQKLIDENLDYNITNTLNYDYSIPILFHKHYFYDMEMINNKHLFIDILLKFEAIMNNNNVLNIKYNDIIEKYYYDNLKMQLFKMTNINLFSNAYLDKNNTLYITNAITGVIKFTKNNDNIFELN